MAELSHLKQIVKNPRPDMDGFLDAMSGRTVPDRAPVMEYLIDNALMKPILEDMLGRTWVETSDKQEYMGGQMDFSSDALDTINAWLDNQIEFWYRMGYDYVRVEVSLPLPAISHVTRDTAEGWQDHNRAWQGLEPGVIQTWEDFEKYDWPRVTDNAFYIHNYICDHLPDGLGFITCHAGGVYEHVSRLMGYEGLCYALYDDRGLVKAVADRIGGLIHEYNERLLQIDGVSAIMQGDDFGFNTQTLIPPNDLREFFLPWHRKFAQQIHAAGRQYYLHSCGRVDELMEEFIDDLKLDGKHSFQDNITPVWEYKKKWGDRIALLGGIDVDKMTSYQPEELRKYVRTVIEKCSPGGRFAVGAGNSVPSYCPVENYLTMLDEALR
jgi:uroporphyrinogen decarboxylase